MIRSIQKTDLSALKTVLDHCNLFPSEYLDGMIAPYLEGGSEDIWYTYVVNDLVVALAYCAPMELTNGTYNLYAIGIHQEHQNKGIGTEMMQYIEHLLTDAGQRILIVETSSSEDQLLARRFYLKCGYTHKATIRDFWDEGDDKVIFWKKLSE